MADGSVDRMEIDAAGAAGPAVPAQQHACVVCMEAFTSKLKQPVPCPYCNEATCMQCAKQCALMWAAAPKCAKCNKSFTTETVDAMFTKGFRRGALRQHAIQNLQEQEMSLLPQTALKMAHQRRVAQHLIICDEMRMLWVAFERNMVLASVPDLMAKMNKLQAQLVELGVGDYGPNGPNDRAKAPKPVVHKTVKCPKDGCMGYIPKSGPGAGSCGLCDTKVCNDCNKMLGAGSGAGGPPHECDPDEVASWTLIKSSSTPCPKCGTAIQKTEGCNQMWCTVPNCCTAFDYITGKIVNGPIHNVHYHEWLRTTGGVGLQANGPHGPNGAPCETPADILGNQRYSEVMDVLRYTFHTNASTPTASKLRYTLCCDFIQVLQHALGYARQNQRREYTQDTYEDLRMKYLNKGITKAQWASKLSVQETLRVKDQRRADLKTMLITAGADLFLKLHRDVLALPYTTQRGMHIYQQPVKVTPHDAALTIITEFVNACEALRVYYIREIVRILSDYSDTMVEVPEHPSADSHRLLWRRCTIGELKGKYNC